MSTKTTSKKTDSKVKKTDSKVKKTDSKVKKTDSKVKKTDSKVKKTDSKVKKDKPKKYKIYCGIKEPIPNGYRLGSMAECYEANKVMYYGVKKIDSRILNLNKNKTDEKSLRNEIAILRGEKTKLKKDLERKDMVGQKSEIEKKIIDIDKKITTILEKIKKMENK
jgi:peptidoglycan hydrolase CwlO-like protein